MFDDIAIYQEKIENKEAKINELKEELKQLEKNIEANNRIFMRKYQKNSKPTKKNMFLFHSSRTGNNINKKQEIIIYKKTLQSYERKKAKSTPKIGTHINTNKNNYFFNNSDKKTFNFNFYGSTRGKTLDYKNNKINLNNIKNMNNNISTNKHIIKNKLGQNINNNMKQIKITSDINQELNSNNSNIIKSNKYNKTEPNYIINIINNYDNNYYNNLNDKIKNKILINKSIHNTSSQNSYNNSNINNRKDNISKDTPTRIKDNYLYDDGKNNSKTINEEIYKNVETRLESIFNKYFTYYNNNINNKCQNNKK